MNNVIAWTIAGSDPSGGAGIQADLQTFQNLGVHGCSIISAVTAQNSAAIQDIHYISAEHVMSQITALQHDLPARAIKIGMLGNPSTVEKLSHFLSTFSGKVVLDPLLKASSGNNLFSSQLNQYLTDLKKIFPHVDLLTPNLIEAATILNRNIQSFCEIEQAAHDLLSLGAKSVLIKGGHFAANQLCQDFWTNGTESCWLACDRQRQDHYHGTGCTLSAAITACLALGYDIKDALVIGKMYITQGIRLAKKYGQGSAFLTHHHWPEHQEDLPLLAPHFLSKPVEKFPSCNTAPLGLYPIVDNSNWLQQLLPLGINTIQLRIKDKTGTALENEIKQATSLAKKWNARLFINDHWELAIRHGAYGVHLGQEDLKSADIETLYRSKLRIGISTHCYYEVARAHALSPSYIACGPIFATTSKIMPFSPQGLTNLQRWRRTLDYPLVAIGGIDAEKLPHVLATGVEGAAMISAITQASNPIGTTQKLLTLTNEHFSCKTTIQH